MKIIPELPAFVVTLLETYLPSVLAWCSRQLYERLLLTAADHLLWQVKTEISFAAIEAACQGYYHQTGRGRPPRYTVAQMSRLLFLKYLYHHSYRASAEAVKFNWLWRWFCGFTLFDETPDHSSLYDFEAWVCQTQPTLYFDELLRQIDKRLPAERKQAQIGDTYALIANAARESLIGLLRHSSRRLLVAVKAASAEVHQQVLAQLDRQMLLGEGKEIPEYRLTPAQQAERAVAVARAVITCCQWVCLSCQQQDGRPAATHSDVALWLRRLEKIVTDEFAVTWGSFLQPVALSLLPEEKRGSYRLGSATDPDATYRKHHDRTDLGYNINLSVTPTGFIREIRADTGAQPDSVAVPLLISAQRERHGFVPPRLIYDRAAGTGKKVAEVAEASGGHTRLVAHMIDYQQRQDRFGPADFSLNDDDSLTCPGGVTSTTAYRAPHGNGVTFRFPAKQCAACDLLQACRGDAVAPERHRQVFISDYRRLYFEALAYSRTDDFQQDMKLRPLVEPVISDLVNHHDGRCARGRGQQKADFHVRMCGMALNTTRFMARLRQKEVAEGDEPQQLAAPSA